MKKSFEEERPCKGEIMFFYEDPLKRRLKMFTNANNTQDASTDVSKEHKESNNQEDSTKLKPIPEED